MKNNDSYIVSSLELRLLSSFVIRASSFIVTQLSDIAIHASITSRSTSTMTHLRIMIRQFVS
jgi:hypothetical protein